MFREKLEQARLNAGLTRTKAGRETYISRNSIQSYETGRAIPNAKKLAMLCRLYKTTPNDLLGFPTNGIDMLPEIT